MTDDEYAQVKEAVGSGLRVIREDKKAKNTLPVKPRVIRFKDSFEFECPNLPPSVINDAKRMSDVYPYFYVFENSVRYFIMTTLEDEYGKDWWVKRVNNTINRASMKRRDDEKEIPWHGKRGKHLIFYTDIKDLLTIIRNDEKLFRPKLPEGRVDWLTNLIWLIRKSRNIIAHNNPLNQRDINRVKINLQDWLDVLEKIL